MRSADQTPSITAEELRRRVVYSLFLPAARLARVFGLSLKDMTSYLHLAYYSELRGEGLTLKEVSQQMDISMRSAARLSKQLKTNFFRPEREHELPRRVEFLLWYEPMSLPRIRRALPSVSDEELDRAMAQLLAEERIVEQPGRTVTYAVARGASRIVRDRWTARIGALNSMLTGLSAVTWGRFFAEDPRSFARTLTFRVRPQDMDQLKNLYEEGVWARLQDLDEAAAGDPDAESMTLTLYWAGYESLPTHLHLAGNDDDDDRGDDPEA